MHHQSRPTTRHGSRAPATIDRRPHCVCAWVACCCVADTLLPLYDRKIRVRKHRMHVYTSCECGVYCTHGGLLSARFGFCGMQCTRARARTWFCMQGEPCNISSSSNVHTSCACGYAHILYCRYQIYSWCLCVCVQRVTAIDQHNNEHRNTHLKFECCIKGGCAYAQMM